MRYLTGLLTRSKKSSSLRAINVLQSKRRRRRLIVEQLEDRRLLATFTVVNTDDSGAGSFRQAIVDANTSLGNDTIQFDSGVNGTITLTSGELAITDSLDVQGPGSNVLAISGNSSSRVFYVSANATISGLTITGGSSSNGGGIYNSGSTLTVGNCTITGNTVGIYNHGGTLTVSNSNFAGNIGSPFTTVSFLGTFDHLVGSGIYNSFGGVATVSGSRFTGNAGSGIFNHYVSGSLTTVNVSHSTFSGNQAEHGGGIYSYGGGIVQVNKSTFVHNSATGQIFSSGGGINCFVGGTLTVSNSTFSENQANYDLDGVNFSGTGGGGGAISVSLGTVTNVSNSTFFGNRSYVAGGAIFTYQATLTVTNSTLFGNTATTLAGGAIWSSGTRPTIGNTIIAGNTAPENPDVRAGVLSTGNNLIGNTSGSNGWVGSDLTGTSALPLNPMLAPLGNYGGPTQTMALLVVVTVTPPLVSTRLRSLSLMTILARAKRSSNIS